MKKTFLLLAVLTSLTAAALQTDVFVSNSNGPACNVGFRKLVLTLDHTFHQPFGDHRSGAELVDLQWRVIDGPYQELFNALGEPLSGMKKLHEQDLAANTPAENLAYLLVKEESTGKVEGWMRVVSNTTPLGHLLGFKAERRSGILPMEVKYPEIIPYLEKRYPRRVEFGRIGTRIDLDDQRLGTLSDMFASATELMNERRSADPVHILLEVPTSRLRMYSGFGFKEIPREELEREIPGLTLSPKFHFMVQDARNLYEQYNGALSRALGAEKYASHDPRELEDRIRRIDEALKTIPIERFQTTHHRAGFEKATALLELGRWEQADAEIRRLEKRSPGSPSVQSLRYRMELFRKFDPLRKTGKLTDALAYLRANPFHGPGGGTFENKIPESDFFEAWFRLEAGDAQAAVALRKKAEAERAVEQAGLPMNYVSSLDDLGKSWASAIDGVYKSDEDKLYAIENDLREPPIGITAPFHRLRAKVLANLGRHEDAKHARRLAEVLEKESPPADYKVGQKARPFDFSSPSSESPSRTQAGSTAPHKHPARGRKPAVPVP